MRLKLALTLFFPSASRVPGLQAFSIYHHVHIAGFKKKICKLDVSSKEGEKSETSVIMLWGLAGSDLTGLSLART